MQLQRAESILASLKTKGFITEYYIAYRITGWNRLQCCKAAAASTSIKWFCDEQGR